MKKSNFKLFSFRLAAIFSFIVLLNVSFIFGSKPKILFSSSILYPRLSMLDSEENTHWRSLLSYDQKFSKNFNIDALLEYGSKNEYLQNSFRIHQFAAELKIANHELDIGRIAIWNALQNARIDGAKLNLNTDKFGVFTFAGGFKAVTDLDDASYSDNTYITASWSKGKLGNNIGISFWAKDDSENFNPFAGVQVSTNKFGIRLVTALAVDLNESKINYGRLRLSKRIGSHTVGIGYRQKRFELWDRFQNIAESIGVSPTMSLDVNSIISENLLWRNQLSYRTGEKGKAFMASSINFKKIYASVLAGLGNENMEYGFILGTTLTINDAFKCGGSVSLNAIDLGNFTDLESSTGAYGWVGWQPKDFVMIKLFGRYANNPYFKQDGRGGIIINVAL